MPELYAYTSVVSLAKQLGPDSDVFADALSDLREQLVDCLTAPPADLTPVAHRGASGPVGSDRRRL
ncbi:MAG TPA: hypothetical protein VKY65_15200 [Alphaproteobacteria bacterium]|nr:hypothetical protein [Alphaproteobacteria bacterium]